MERVEFDDERWRDPRDPHAAAGTADRGDASRRVMDREGHAVSALTIDVGGAAGRADLEGKRRAERIVGDERLWRRTPDRARGIRRRTGQTQAILRGQTGRPIVAQTLRIVREVGV